MGGQRKSEASLLSSPDVRALWEEPTEASPLHHSAKEKTRRLD
jgi:hypothetical protein